MIYLRGDSEFANVQVLREPAATNDAGLYIRSIVSGRYLLQGEEKNLIPVAYFQSIRDSSALSATFRSLIFFDRSAEFTKYTGENLSLSRNMWTRIIKIGLLGLTAVSYANAQKSAARLAGGFYVFDQSARANRSFEQARNTYYGIGLFTLAYYGYIAFRAYREFGRDSEGNDLRLNDRNQIDSGEILRESASRESSWLDQGFLTDRLRTVNVVWEFRI